MVSREELQEIRQKVEKGQKADAIIIPKAELDRIKNNTVVTTKEQEIEQKKLMEE